MTLVHNVIESLMDLAEIDTMVTVVDAFNFLHGMKVEDYEYEDSD